MLDVLASGGQSPGVEALAQVHGEALADPVGTVASVDRLLGAYAETQRLRPDVYNHRVGFDRFLADLTADVVDRSNGDMKAVLAMGQRYLTGDELKNLTQFLRQTRGFWQGMLWASQTEVDIKGGIIKQKRETESGLSQHQHELSRLVYEIGFSDKESPERTTFAMLRRLLQKLDAMTDSPILQQANRILSGSLAQAALMREFSDSGYHVLIPDPNSAVDTVYTDMKGVDFVAISPIGDILCIDSKGENHRHANSPVVRSRGLSRSTSTHIIQDIRGKTYRRGRHDGLDIILDKGDSYRLPWLGFAIAVPTGEQYMDIGQFNDRWSGRFMADIFNQVDRIMENEDFT